MSKIPASKHKIDRRLGVNLWGRPGSPFNTRNFGPGQHGKQKGKPTDYGVQLKAKQKLKGHYGRVGERQFRRIYQEAIRRKGDSSENLIGLLECRLDTVVYRAKFGATVFAARQLVSHGHITVDGKRVNVPSAYVREGQVVAVRDKTRTLSVVIGAVESQERSVPDYLDVQENGFAVRFVRQPKLAEVPYAVKMEPNLVLEFYSR
ncbi:MAG: 30S ribosomal protein S4 [Holosporales bacterium]|jgi:small subunit ribosomal protein S4